MMGPRFEPQYPYYSYATSIELSFGDCVELWKVLSTVDEDKLPTIARKLIIGFEDTLDLWSKETEIYVAQIENMKLKRKESDD